MTTLTGGCWRGGGGRARAAGRHARQALPYTIAAFLFAMTRGGGGGGRTKRPTAARAGAALRMPTPAGVAV